MVIVCLLPFFPGTASAIVGFADEQFLVGDNLFGNPLLNTANDLNTLFTSSSMTPSAPDGTTISRWSSTASAYTETSTYSSGAWSDDFTLLPGEGALLHTSSIFSNRFIGQPLAPDGSIFVGVISLPSPFNGPSGIYLLSSKFPVNLPSGGNSVFESILGRAPQDGESFTTYDTATQTSNTTTFASGAWNNGDPVLTLGDAAFFNLVGVPEPSVGSLTVVGFCFCWIVSRRRRANAPATST